MICSARIRGTLVVALPFLILFFGGAAAQDMNHLGIVTGSKTGTYFQIGNDINKIITYVCHAPVAVHDSAGSLDNLRRLRKEEFVQLALAQHDVLSFIKVYRQDDIELQDWVNKFRYVFSLYPEEVHIVTRRGSGVNSLRDLAGRRVGMGLADSGTMITATLLLGLVDLKVHSEQVGSDEALGRLFLDSNDPKHLDAFFQVAGKPFKLLTGNAPRQSDLTLVAIDDPRVFQLYKRAAILKADYPWLDHDTETVAVMSALVTFDFQGNNCGKIAMVARQIEANLDELQRTGHPKWSDVRLGEPVPGWERYRCATERQNTAITGCRFAEPEPEPRPSASPGCLERCGNLPGPEKIICELGCKR